MNEKSKVIVLSCDSYEEERIYTLLKRGLKELGGIYSDLLVAWE